MADDPDVTAWRSWNEKGVPLSAIRALVQQWREEAEEMRLRQYNATIWKAVAFEVKLRADQLAALRPAPPEDQP